MVYANAGHLPALHLHAWTGEAAWLEPRGPVGLKCSCAHWPEGVHDLDAAEESMLS
jgi:hypothetical protein